MKIGKPVKEVPENTARHWGKYLEVWKAVESLPNGDRLPVQCETKKAATLLYYAAHTHRTLPLRAKQRDNVDYVQRRTQRTGSGELARNAREQCAALKKERCDKCGHPVNERFQCGDLWLCGPCYPKDRKKLYPLWRDKR